MCEKQTNIKMNEETDLRELILVLWKRKVMIISLTLIFTILSGIISKFILLPVYDTKLNIVISMPEVYVTKFGDFTLPITSNDQYINLIKSNDVIVNTIKDMKYLTNKVSVEDIKDKISIGNINSNSEIKQNSFHVTVSGDNPIKSLKLAEFLYENYIEFLNVMMKERAIKYYYNDFNVKIETAKILLKTKEAELKENENLLKETPQTINQKDAVKEIIPGTSDFVILENIINPNYTTIEEAIIQNKQDINTAKITIADYSSYLNELGIEQETLNKYYESGDPKLFVDSLFDIVDTNIYLASKPVAPTKKTSPSNVKNAIIGGFCGGMLGVMIAFIVAYFKKEI